MKYIPASLLPLTVVPVTAVAANVHADSQQIARPAVFPAVTRHQSLDSLKAEVKQQL